MKRAELIAHLSRNGCKLLREGANHSIYSNPLNGNQASVGRHRELSDLLCQKVCKQLGVPPIERK